MITKLVLLGLGCVVGTVLVACGGSGETTANQGRGGEIKGTVTVGDLEYESFTSYTDAVNELDKEFEKLHPEVTVDRVAQPYESYEAIYRAAFTAHEGPDVMLMQPGASGVLSFQDGLEV